MRRLLLLILLAAALGPPALAAQPEKKKGGGESFVVLPNLTASMTRPTGRRGVLIVEAGLDIADRGLRARAEASKPRLQDAYVQALTRLAAQIPPGSAPDPDAIGVVLQKETDRVLGKPGARLLLGGVMAN